MYLGTAAVEWLSYVDLFRATLIKSLISRGKSLTNLGVLYNTVFLGMSRTSQ